MEAKDLLLILGTKFAAAPGYDTLAITNKSANSRVYFLCTGAAKAKYLYAEGSEYQEQRTQSGSISFNANIPGTEFRLRYLYNSITIYCNAQTAAISLNDSEVSTLYLRSEGSPVPDYVLELGDAVTTLHYIEMRKESAQFAAATVSGLLSQLTADTSVIKNNGTLVLVGHSLSESDQSMVAQLTAKGWRVFYDTDEYLQFNHTAGTFTVTAFYAGNYHLGESITSGGTSVLTTLSNPKWYDQPEKIESISYSNIHTLSIPQELHGTLRGLNFNFGGTANHQSIFSQIDSENLNRFTGLNTFTYRSSIKSQVTGTIRLPDLTSGVTIQGIEGYTVYLNPVTTEGSNSIQGAVLIQIGNNQETYAGVTVNSSSTSSSPVAIECNNTKTQLALGYITSLTLPKCVYSVKFLAGRRVSGTLKNLPNFNLAGSTTLNFAGQAVRNIEVPAGTGSAWPLTIYNFSDNRLSEAAMNGLIQYLSRQSWGTGKTFNLKDQLPYQAPSDEAVALITGGQVKATVLYNRKNEFDLDVSGAGMDLFNSCYKLTEYSNGSYEYNYGRFYENGAGYYIYEVDIDRSTPTSGQYRYVIKAWVITTRLIWQENLGPDFLGESANTYKIVNRFEQWQGDTMIGEISSTQTYAGSGMGAVPELKIINQ